MSSPCSIHRNQPTRIDSLAEHVLRNEFALVPRYNLFLVRILCGMFAVSQVAKPVVIGVLSWRTVLQPFVQEHVG